MDEFIVRQRAIWAAGDYATLSEYIADVGEYVVARAGVEPGMDVLDVACGTGNAAIPAARAGATVTGLDLVPELLEAGRAKAAAARVQIEWVVGNAEELPFADESFDRVFSTFGHMFAPRHQRTADEMARVCRAGGRIAICCWTPEGAVGDLFRATGAYMPSPPDYAQPPLLWGTEDHVRSMWPSASSVEFERRDAMIEWESVEGFADFFLERFGPMVTARAMLGERFADLRSDAIAAWKARNQADDSSFRLGQEYLVSLVRL